MRYFCDMPEDKKNPLHLVQSFHLDQRVQRYAKILDDTILYAKLQQRDMIALDALYRRKYLLDPYRTANAKQPEGYYTYVERQPHGIAFSEIISFVEEAFNTSVDAVPLFNLT